MLDQVKFTEKLKSISETVDQDEKAARGWHMNVSPSGGPSAGVR